MFLYFIGRRQNDNVILELPRQIATAMDSGVSSCLLMLHPGICPLDCIKFPMGLDAYGLGNESFSNNQKTPSPCHILDTSPLMIPGRNLITSTRMHHLRVKETLKVL